MINLPSQVLTGFKRKAEDTLLVRDKLAQFIRIELSVHYYIEVNGDDVEIKQTHHSLVANNSVMVDPQTLDIATEETINPVGEYDAYEYLISTGAVPVQILIDQSILIADQRGRFN